MFACLVVTKPEKARVINGGTLVRATEPHFCEKDTPLPQRWGDLDGDHAVSLSEAPHGKYAIHWRKSQSSKCTSLESANQLTATDCTCEETDFNHTTFSDQNFLNVPSRSTRLKALLKSIHRRKPVHSDVDLERHPNALPIYHIIAISRRLNNVQQQPTKWPKSRPISRGAWLRLREHPCKDRLVQSPACQIDR